MQDIFDQYVAAGEDGLRMFTVNTPGEESLILGYVEYEDPPLQCPVLQDTLDADVDGLWGAGKDDIFVVNQSGEIVKAFQGKNGEILDLSTPENVEKLKQAIDSVL